MRRLVYSPRAHVFTKNRQGKILNVSKYVTAGNVRRVVNAVSSADITLRNPDKIFTTPDPADATVAFMPMDPITIYLERIKGRPVRVFTGFLDTTPYLQLYPGVVTLKASCTLKRLQYTYFDPALPYTQSFLSAYGWLNVNGTVVNQNGLNDWKKQDGTTAKYGDGSVAELLFATLTNIGHWGEKEIFIEKMPHDLFGRLSKIYTEAQVADNLAVKDYEDLLARIVGSGSYGSGGGTGGDLSTGNVKDKKSITQAAIAAADKWNVPAELPLTTLGCETGWTGVDQAGGAHLGWLQWDSRDGPPGSYGAVGVTRSKKDGSHDVGFATDLFCEAASRRAKKDPSLKSDLMTWALVTQGANDPMNRANYQKMWPSRLDQAKKWIAQYGTDPAGIGADAPVPDQLKNAGSNSSSGDSTKIYAPIAGGTTGISSPFGEPNHGNPPHVHMGIDVPVPTGTECVAPTDGKIGKFASAGYAFGGAGGMVHFIFTKDTGEIKAGTVIGWGHIGTCKVKPGQSVKAGQVLATSNHPAPHVHFIMRNDPNDMDGTVNPTPVFKALQKGETAPTTGGSSADATTGSNTDPSQAFASANAFAVTFDFPGIQESVEATGLGGQLSLLNDKPLLPFIQQLTDASLRQFQSLPDGSIFAFFPDYFGEMLHHPAYWDIDDIEILDGNVMLSDDALVTHSYVVGDTTWPASNSLINTLSTKGVVSVYNAFLSDLITPSAKKLSKAEKKALTKDEQKAQQNLDLMMDFDQASQFLDRFGARPQVEDMSMIHSPFFEFFLAYQRFMLGWARQFITPFEFTFMPELYPGGKVAFREHGLQMYIEDVTHSWNYDNGFTTSANLSAPSVIDPKDTRGLPPNMVKAIIGSSQAKLVSNAQNSD